MGCRAGIVTDGLAVVAGSRGWPEHWIGNNQRPIRTNAVVSMVLVQGLAASEEADN